MPAIRYSNNNITSLEPKPGLIVLQQSAAQAESFIFNLIMAFLAGASLVVACLQFRLKIRKWRNKSESDDIELNCVEGGTNRAVNTGMSSCTFYVALLTIHR